jgi:hypothetical protein
LVQADSPHFFFINNLKEKGKMKSINIALSTTIAALMAGTASTAWAGMEGPMINTAGYAACEIYDSNDYLQHIKGGSTQVLHSTEAGSGNVNAVCNGKDMYLVGDYDDKAALHFGPDERGYPKCRIEYTDSMGYSARVSTSDWKQTLTNKGNFSLKCHYKPYDMD